MKLGPLSYLKAAFNARPWGMFVPPNWIGLAAFALLGAVSWGFWLVGAGLEIAYLYALTTNARFRAGVDARATSQLSDAWKQRVDERLARLDRADRARYDKLSARCRAVLADQHEDAAGLEVQQEGLGRLLALYLRLLLMRQGIQRVLHEAKEIGQDNLTRRVMQLEQKIAGEPSEELRRSLSHQLELLRQRSAYREEAGRKVEYLDAELERIEQQVELLREQTALSASAEGLSLRIDTIGATLGETMQWVQEQEELLGGMDELVDEAPRLSAVRSR